MLNQIQQSFYRLSMVLLLLSLMGCSKLMDFFKPPLDNLLTREEKVELLYTTGVDLYKIGIRNQDFDKLERANTMFLTLKDDYGHEPSETYLEKIASYKQDKIASYKKKIAYYKSKNYKYMASVFYRRLLVLQPKNKEAVAYIKDNKTYLDHKKSLYLLNGYQALDKEDPKKAREYFQWILWLEPDNVKATKGLEHVRSWSEAKAQTFYFKGVQALSQKKYTQARNYLKKAQEFGFPSKEVTLALEQANQGEKGVFLESFFLTQLRSNNYEEAKKTLNLLKATDPNNPKLAEFTILLTEETQKYVTEIFHQGVKLYNSKEYNNALSVFTKVKTLRPDYPGLKEYMYRTEAKLSVLESAGPMGRGSGKVSPEMLKKEQSGWERSGVKIQ